MPENNFVFSSRGRVAEGNPLRQNPSKYGLRYYQDMNSPDVILLRCLFFQVWDIFKCLKNIQAQDTA